MALKAIYEKKDDIPEEFQELYTERDDKWECTGIEGLKTEADIKRIQEGARKERENHKDTKKKLEKWADLDHEEVMGKLDKYDELEAAAGDKLDDKKIDELVEKRITGRLASVERDRDKFKKESGEKDLTLVEYQGRETRRKVHDAVREAATDKITPSAMPDVLMNAERMLHVTEDGVILTKDEVGVSPGVAPEVWLGEMLEKRTHWAPSSEGGGAPGSSGTTGGSGNPFTKKHWNLTEQGRVYREKGVERAEQLAKAAGVKIGATHPAEQK